MTAEAAAQELDRNGRQTEFALTNSGAGKKRKSNLQPGIPSSEEVCFLPRPHGKHRGDLQPLSRMQAVLLRGPYSLAQFSLLPENLSVPSDEEAQGFELLCLPPAERLCSGY